MDKIQALNNFWNGFGLAAYDESTVPDNTSLPYITYSVAEDDLGYPVSVTASIWYRSKRWDEITLKLEQISGRISRSGVIIRFDDGAIWLKKGSPFAQRLQDEDDSIRRIFMNIEIEYLN